MNFGSAFVAPRCDAWPENYKCSHKGSFWFSSKVSSFFILLLFSIDFINYKI